VFFPGNIVCVCYCYLYLGFLNGSLSQSSLTWLYRIGLSIICYGIDTLKYKKTFRYLESAALCTAPLVKTKYQNRYSNHILVLPYSLLLKQRYMRKMAFYKYSSFEENRNTKYCKIRISRSIRWTGKGKTIMIDGNISCYMRFIKAPTIRIMMQDTCLQIFHWSYNSVSSSE